MCIAFTPDCAFDNSTIVLIKDVYCPNTKCLGKLCLHKNSFSWQKRISMSAMRVCVPGAQYSFWRSNKLLLLIVWPGGLHFWRESKINSRCCWRCVLSWQVLFQQREIRFSWQLCNNSELLLWLWKIWSLVICSQISFIHFQTILKLHDFLSPQRRYWVVLDFGPDSVTLTVKDLVQEMTKRSQEILLAAWSLLLSQTQQFLNNHLARVPVTPNQQGTHEMSDEVLSSVGAQDMDTSGYQVSADLDDVEFYWQNEQLEIDTVFRPGIDSPFSPTAFEDLEMGDSAENPILLDDEVNKEKTSMIPCIAEKLSIWNKDRKCSWLCL